MGRFQPGQSGKPGGRPKAEVLVRDLARQHTEDAIRALVGALRAKSESVRVAAATALLDRGWGRPPQAVSIESHRDVVEMDAAELLAIARGTEPR